MLDCTKDLVDNFGASAIFLGTRRTDPYSADLEYFCKSSNGWPKFTRVLPILDFFYSQIWSFMGEFEVPYCKLYDLGYTYLGDKLDSVPNPFSQIDQGPNSVNKNSEDPFSDFYEVDALGSPDTMKFLKRNFSNTLSDLHKVGSNSENSKKLIIPSSKKYKPAFMSTDNYEPFSRISNYNNLPLSGNGKFLLQAQNIKALVIRSENDVDPLKILDERIDMVEIAVDYLARHVENIEVNLDIEQIRNSVEHVTVITEKFSNRVERDNRVRVFLREAILKEVRDNGKSRQPVYLILIDLIEKECVVFD